MRIAFFHNLPDGGAKRVLYEQVKNLLKYNYVEVYEIDNKENFFDLYSLGVKINKYKFKIDQPIFGITCRITKDFNNFYNLKKLHKKIARDVDNKKYDIVIVHPDKFTQAPFILSFLKTRNIYYCEEFLRIVYEDQFKLNGDVPFIKNIYEEMTRKIRKNIDYSNARYANFIISNSKFTSDNIKKVYFRDSFVCYPGIDERVFKPLRLKKEYDILFIGEKNKFDGYDIFKKSIEMFAKKPIIKIISRKSGKFSLSDKELVNEYNKSKLTVAINHNEPFGFIPLESMSCSVPVIAAREGGFLETVIDKKTGLLVERNPDDIYNALYNLLKNDTLREGFSINSRKYILSTWTWEKRIKNLLDIIDKCKKKQIKN